MINIELEVKHIFESGANEIRVIELIKNILSKETTEKQELKDCRIEAESLAIALWEQHYKSNNPKWELLPDVSGIITQINNMISGLTGEISRLKRMINKLKQGGKG